MGLDINQKRYFTSFHSSIQSLLMQWSAFLKSVLGILFGGTVILFIRLRNIIVVKRPIQSFTFPLVQIALSTEVMQKEQKPALLLGNVLQILDLVVKVTIRVVPRLKT